MAGSSLKDEIRLGDKIIAVDDEDVSKMKAEDIQSESDLHCFDACFLHFTFLTCGPS